MARLGECDLRDHDRQGDQWRSSSRYIGELSAVGTRRGMIRYLTLALALLAAAPAYGQTPPYLWYRSPVMPAPPWWNADIDKGSAATRTVIYNDRGGNLNFYSARWRALAESGSDVEIRGACMSACTTIMVYVPHDKLCFGK